MNQCNPRILCLSQFLCGAAVTGYLGVVVSQSDSCAQEGVLHTVCFVSAFYLTMLRVGSSVLRQAATHRPAATILTPLIGARRFFKVPAVVQPEPKDFGVFKVYIDGQMFAWLVMDRPGKSENAIGADFQESILKATKYIREQHDAGNCKLCILTSAKKRFCVGADITEFYHTTERKSLTDRIAAGKKAMKSLTDLPIPTVAAINGDALGGGLEIALACDYRVAAASNKHNLGLPEVMLGVLPGLGGTVRMPKLIGIQNALQYVLQVLSHYVGCGCLRCCAIRI